MFHLGPTNLDDLREAVSMALQEASFAMGNANAILTAL
jgi:hypothetical protein